MVTCPLPLASTELTSPPDAGAVVAGALSAVGAVSETVEDWFKFGNDSSCAGPSGPTDEPSA